MPLNPDEAANDEWKTYHDEGFGRDEGHDLNDIKGDLVNEDDEDEIRQPYQNKVGTHSNGEVGQRRKEDSDREQTSDAGPTSRNFSYPPQDIGPIMPGFNPLFTNGLLPSSPPDQQNYGVQWSYEQNYSMEQYGLSVLQEPQADIQTEMAVFAETECNGRFPTDCTSQPSRPCLLVAEKCLDLLHFQTDAIQELKSAVTELTSIAKSQVPYSPYMGRYMGPLFCGASSPIDLDAKQGSRPPPSDVPPMYPLPGQLGQIPNHLAPWPPSPLYPALCSAAVTGMLPYPYPFSSLSSAGAMGTVSPFPFVPPHPHGGGIHPNMLHPGALPFSNHINGQNGGPKSNSDKKLSGSDGCSLKRSKNADKPSRPYVKKPLNAFMLYMKEQRAQVVAECTLKESAAINQILGRKWHSLKREEQQKYYEMARKERQLHMQMFPGWSARDNYGKRKKRKKEKTQDCMASNQFMRPSIMHPISRLPEDGLIRRKKKCIRYQQDGEDSDDSDCSPEQYQCSQDIGSFPHPIGNQNLNSIDDSPVVSSSNGIINQSDDIVSTTQTSPDQSALSERVKLERSPPLPRSGNERFTEPPSTNSFHSPDFPTATSTSTSINSNENCGSSVTKKTPPSTNDVSTASALGSKHRPVSDDQYQPPNINGLAPDGKQAVSHTSESPITNGGNSGPIGRQSIFNSPMLSPGMNLSSPHNSPHAFLPNFSYFAAAGIPTSPLGGLMNLPNFKNFPPMNMGLQGPGPAVPSGSHPGGGASRHNTSALEGKS